MRPLITLLSLTATAVLILAACGAATPTATPTPTEGPNAGTDLEVQAYLALMDELAIELTSFDNPDGGGGSIEKVIALASKLKAYLPFFATLDGELRQYVLSIYEPRLKDTAIQVGKLLVMAHEITGSDAMVSALQQTPAFALVISDNGRPNARISNGGIRGLLSADEVANVVGTQVLSLTERDQKAAAAAVDPAQVEHIDSFASLTFSDEADTRSLTLTTIDFDSKKEAVKRYDLLVGEQSGLQEMPVAIGDASSQTEINGAGVGSMIVAVKGEWVVVLHTAQHAEFAPLAGLDGLDRLARLVSDKLPQS